MLVIASSSTERLTYWRQGLNGIDAILEVTDRSMLQSCLESYKPRFLLLDVELRGFGGASAIRKLRQASPTTKIVALGEQLSDAAEVALFVAGVRGCCHVDVEPQVLKRVVTAVGQGEPWIRRSLVPRLLDELAARSLGEAVRPVYQSGPALSLTAREQQIASLIRTGESNKQIARRLDITERTVKAHLTDIFRKLGIDDRLKLALMMSDSA